MGKTNVLLPMAVYRTLKDQSEKELAACEANQNDEQAYEPFVLEDYVDNPVALARIKAGITQERLIQRLGVSQAYISQIERRSNITNSSAVIFGQMKKSTKPILMQSYQS